MSQPHHNPPLPKTNRRAFLLSTAAGITAVAGCLGDLSGDSGPRERSFSVTITTSGAEPDGTVEGAEVEDVVQVHVGDTVSFTFSNDAGEPVGVHDHASDAEIVIEPGDEGTMEFEVTEAMIGRQEIEAWFVDDTGNRENGEHGADATPIVIVEVRPRGG